MANITIPNLPQAVSIDGTEQLLGVQSGTSKAITTGQIVSLATGGGGTTPLAVVAGGTGNTTFDNYGLLYGDGTNPIESITPPVGADYILVASPGSVPVWQENIPVTSGVNSISFGTTGLTPSTATEGNISVDGTLVAVNGGTGQSSYTIGDLLYASSSTALSKLADVATGSVLISGGVGVAPSYSSSPTLTTSLTTPLLIGGTTASSSLTLQSTSGIGTTDSILFKVGSNGATTAMTISSAGVVSLLSALPATSGGTGQSSYAVGDLLYADTTTSLAKLADVAIGSVLISGGVAGSPSYSASPTISTSVTTPAIYGGTASSSALSLYSTSGVGTTDAMNFYTGSQVQAMRIRTDQNVTIGSTVGSGSVVLGVNKTMAGNATSRGIEYNGSVDASVVTTNAYIFNSAPDIGAGTLTTLAYYRAAQGTLTGTVTNQYGFTAASTLTGATTNIGFRGDIDSATGCWNFYASGTANNAFIGDTRIGSGVAPTKTLDITGTLGVSGAVTLSTPLPVASGGTGASTANAALTNLTEFTSTATAAGTTVLTNTSTYFQFFTGVLTQTITLPVTSTLAQGWTFHIVNNSTGNLTVNSSGGNLVITVLPGTTAMATCILTSGTTAASWEAGLTDFSTATGTGSVVLSASPTLTGTATATTLSATTLTATAGAGFQNIVFLTSGASYSLPSEVQVTGAKFKVTVIGAGGGGGGNPATAATAGGGGGAGGVAVAVLTYVSGQNSVTTSFGTAGAGTSGAAGGAGTSTTATYNSLTYIGTGGGGGALGAATSAGGAGGTGTTGTGTESITLTGQSGGTGGTTTAVAGVTYLNNSGGNTPLGYGMGGLMPFAGAAGSAGTSPTNYGSGGSGSVAGSTAAAKAGASGAPGAIIIEY